MNAKRMFGLSRRIHSLAVVLTITCFALLLAQDSAECLQQPLSASPYEVVHVETVYSDLNDTTTFTYVVLVNEYRSAEDLSHWVLGQDESCGCLNPISSTPDIGVTVTTKECLEPCKDFLHGGTFKLLNFPDSDLYHQGKSPLHGLRIDKMDGVNNYTWDFEHPLSDVRLHYNPEEGTVQISGVTWGGVWSAEAFPNYANGELWDISFSVSGFNVIDATPGKRKVGSRFADQDIGYIRKRFQPTARFDLIEYFMDNVSLAMIAEEGTLPLGVPGYGFIGWLDVVQFAEHSPPPFYRDFLARIGDCIPPGSDLKSKTGVAGVRFGNPIPQGKAVVHRVTYPGRVFQTDVEVGVQGEACTYSIGKIHGPSSCDYSECREATVQCDAIGELPADYTRTDGSCPDQYDITRKCEYPNATIWNVYSACGDEGTACGIVPTPGCTAGRLSNLSVTGFEWFGEPKLYERPDGTAHLVGMIQNSNVDDPMRFELDLELSSRTDSITSGGSGSGANATFTPPPASYTNAETTCLDDLTSVTKVSEWQLHNHPNAVLFSTGVSPAYGLRIDQLDGVKNFTFNFEHAKSDVRMRYHPPCSETDCGENAHNGKIRIYGKVWGGTVPGTTAGYSDGELWTLDFTYFKSTRFDGQRKVGATYNETDGGWICRSTPTLQCFVLHSYQMMHDYELTFIIEENIRDNPDFSGLGWIEVESHPDPHMTISRDFIFSLGPCLPTPQCDDFTHGGIFKLHNHPRSVKFHQGVSPPYGLRVDRMDNVNNYTFDFDHPDSNMKIIYDKVGGWVQIVGKAVGGTVPSSSFPLYSDPQLYEISFIAHQFNQIGDQLKVATTYHEAHHGYIRRADNYNLNWTFGETWMGSEALLSFIVEYNRPAADGKNEWWSGIGWVDIKEFPDTDAEHAPGSGFARDFKFLVGDCVAYQINQPPCDLSTSWHYYQSVQGTLTAVEGTSLYGAVLSLTSATPLPIGAGASLQNLDLGFRLEFAYNVSEQPASGPALGNGGGVILGNLQQGLEGCCAEEEVIHVVDTSAPSFLDPPSNIVIQGCNDQNLPPCPTLQAIDNCGRPQPIECCEHILNATSDMHKMVVRSWTAVDRCGNANCITQTITCLPAATSADDLIDPTGEIGGHVFLDINGNMQRDQDEPALQNVVVELNYHDDSHPDKTVAVAITNANGYFSFGQQNASFYRIELSMTGGALGMESPGYQYYTFPKGRETDLQAYATGVTYTDHWFPVSFNVPGLEAAMNAANPSNATQPQSCGRNMAFWKENIVVAMLHAMGAGTLMSDNVHIPPDDMLNYLTQVESVAIDDPEVFMFGSGNDAERAMKAYYVMHNNTATDAPSQLARELLATELNHVSGRDLLNLPGVLHQVIQIAEFYIVYSEEFPRKNFMEMQNLLARFNTYNAMLCSDFATGSGSDAKQQPLNKRTSFNWENKAIQRYLKSVMVMAQLKLREARSM